MVLFCLVHFGFYIVSPKVGRPQFRRRVSDERFLHRRPDSLVDRTTTRLFVEVSDPKVLDSPRDSYSIVLCISW